MMKAKVVLLTETLLYINMLVQLFLSIISIVDCYIIILAHTFVKIVTVGQIDACGRLGLLRRERWDTASDHII